MEKNKCKVANMGQPNIPWCSGADGWWPWPVSCSLSAVCGPPLRWSHGHFNHQYYKSSVRVVFGSDCTLTRTLNTVWAIPTKLKDQKFQKFPCISISKTVKVLAIILIAALESFYELFYDYNY